ncbi:hypothetical protein ['Camptotheca acuminata' phytoplasma]|uniref:hypothetical protein n=1 Tax='Camptotheca acuminata' phytoplasma TaxID=3239192 RepID=UPI00351A179F
MNSKKTLENIKDNVFLNDFNIKVQNRYIENENKKKIREWFIKDFNFFFENVNYFLPELVIKFGYIDEDNPEFFLQPQQIIKILDSQFKVLDRKNKKYVLIINKFRQESEE